MEMKTIINIFFIIINTITSILIIMGTVEVEALAMRTVYGPRDLVQAPGRRTVERTVEVEREVVRILDGVEEEERRQIGRMRGEMARTRVELLEGMDLLEAGQVLSMADLGRRFWEELAKEEALFRRTYSSFYAVLAEKLLLRFRQCQQAEKARWKGVGVTSEQLLKEKVKLGLIDTKNFITLDSIQLDQDEEAYLGLPYKFREYQPPDSKDFEVECEARDAKLRWRRQ